MKDERYKQLMKDMGMPNSRSLLLTLQQVSHEVSMDYKEEIDKLKQTTHRLQEMILILVDNALGEK